MVSEGKNPTKYKTTLCFNTTIMEKKTNQWNVGQQDSSPLRNFSKLDVMKE